MAQIYLVINSINDKKYIGQTKRSLADRWYDHLKSAHGKNKDCPALYGAMRKYGTDAFRIESLCEVADEDLDEAEKFLITILGARLDYNLDGGGRGRKRYTHSLESRQKMSETRKLLWKNREYRDRMVKAHLGQLAWNKGRKCSNA